MLLRNIDEILEVLQNQGYRTTEQRRIILEAVVGQQGHFTANAILAEVQQRAPFIGRATIFRSLELLTRLGLLSRVHEIDGCHGYVLCDNSHHHHLVCSQCGRVVNVPNCDLTEQTRELSRMTKFRIDSHRLEYFGVCGPCQKKTT